VFLVWFSWFILFVFLCRLVLDFQNPYVLAQKQWFDFAAASAATNDPFLLWGTCQVREEMDFFAGSEKTRDFNC
jgi:membrane-anchored protein YejM (alkaline phosphatase superfamily)